MLRILTSLIAAGIAFLALRLGVRAKRSSSYKKVLQRRETITEVKNRTEIISKLSEKTFDILVIGGGSTGCGVAMDASTRGLSVALIERFDFGSETSSKSTKLLHGGIRYLIDAFKKLSIPHLMFVINALNERRKVMYMAPYLTSTVRIMIPIYKHLSFAFYYVVAKAYDWLSFGQSLGRTYVLSKEHACIYYSNLDANSLNKAIVYYDGMMNDARINVMLAKTASSHGAIVGNHISLVKFEKNENGKIEYALCVDNITKKNIKIKAKVFISATGSFADEVRSKGKKESKRMLVASSGTHMVLNSEAGPENMGILDTKTWDNRILFILPWKNRILAGATEKKRDLKELINPTCEEIDNLINEVKKFSMGEINNKDIKSVWTGIRPLIQNENEKSTANLVRSFTIVDDDNGLITTVGGKWTIFRKMAEKTVDLAVKNYKLNPFNKCITNSIRIVGTEGYAKDLYYSIKRALNVSKDYAKHLNDHYGSLAYNLAPYISKYPQKLSEKFPFLLGEAIYCIENEYACDSIDILNNRFGIGFVDILEMKKMKESLDGYLKEYFESKNEKFEYDAFYNEKTFDAFGHDLIKGFN